MNSIWILFLTAFISGVHCARIDQNGYKGITISFSDKTLQKTFDFEKLKDVLRNASDILFQATRRRSYFEEFILVVPSTRTDYTICDEDAKDAPEGIDIYVTDSPKISSLTTQHSKGCGEKGDIIYMSTDWLTGNVEDLALQFVQRWSTFRYGVFPENPERRGSCISTSDSSWSPTGCFNVKLEMDAIFDENGLPVCELPDNFHEEDLQSSIMFSTNSSKAHNFCDGSDAFPHNPIAPTLHNRICEGYPVWWIIKNTEDFLYSRNMPVEEAKPPTFRCFKESKAHMTLAVQDTDSEARTEIRYALLYFLSNLAAGDLNASLVTFSNDTLTDAMEPLILDLENEANLKSLLVIHLKLNKKVPNVCLICGLRKAYEVSEESQHQLRVIVLFARSSSLQNNEIPELIELIKNKDQNSALYLLFLEDTDEDISPSLVDAMQGCRGRIVRIKNDRVLMFSQMNIALLDASKNILHTEDKILVVHQKTHENVASSFSDVFVTPKNVKGKLLYSMQCKKRGEIASVSNNCSFLDQELQSPICESKLDIKDEGFPKVWKYSFDYMAGSEGTTCVALALLRLDPASVKNSLTVNGWLNQNNITPGHKALIIYAEVFGRKDENIHVEALISGPGLADFRLELRDNGNGDPDIIKGDHIYSRYFTSFTQKGSYTVSIYATSSIGESPKGNSKKEESITAQTKVVGSFRVTESPPKEDIIPPNRVNDLDVISINNVNKTVLLQWTAPGDNYDDGKVKKYIIKLSNHWTSLLDFPFDLKENIELNTDEFSPESSGMTENLRVQCLQCKRDTAYYLALKATDDKGNKGRISNVIQVYFTDGEEISTETYNRNSSPTSSPFVSTDVFNSTSVLPNNDTEEDSTTVITPTEVVEGIFIKRKIIVIAASTSGAILVLLIIISIIVCYCCFRRGKNSVKPKKISRKASLRPPYNLNIAYRHGSQSSLDENEVSNSVCTLVDHTTVYSSSDERQTQGPNNYTYHTSKSLINKVDNQNTRNNLGFQVVQPAYATSSLSRFVARKNDMHTDREYSRSNDSQNPSANNAQDTRVYSLGEV